MLPKITITWCTVTEIQSETAPVPPSSNDHENQNFEEKKKNEKKCLEILSFYPYMCTINKDHMIYRSSNISLDRKKFLSFRAIFSPFNPLTTWKIKILKLKKTPENIIVLHICTINDNHMMYGSWDIERNRQNFCHFGPMKKWKKKNTWRYYHFTHVYHNDNQMMHVSWDIGCDSHSLFFLSFWTVFCPFTHLTTQKIKILKKWRKKKKTREILTFYTCVP